MSGRPIKRTLRGLFRLLFRRCAERQPLIFRFDHWRNLSPDSGCFRHQLGGPFEAVAAAVLLVSGIVVGLSVQVFTRHVIRSAVGVVSANETGCRREVRLFHARNRLGEILLD